MKKILMTRLSVCSLGVLCNEMINTPMLLVVVQPPLPKFRGGATPPTPPPPLFGAPGTELIEDDNYSEHYHNLDVSFSLKTIFEMIILKCDNSPIICTTQRFLVRLYFINEKINKKIISR